LTVTAIRRRKDYRGEGTPLGPRDGEELPNGNYSCRRKCKGRNQCYPTNATPEGSAVKKNCRWIGKKQKKNRQREPVLKGKTQRRLSAKERDVFGKKEKTVVEERNLNL